MKEEMRRAKSEYERLTLESVQKLIAKQNQIILYFFKVLVKYDKLSNMANVFQRENLQKSIQALRSSITEIMELMHPKE